MQHRIKGQLTFDGPSYSVRASHPIATRLWSDGYSHRTSVGRWAVVWAMPGSEDPDGRWRVFAPICVARLTSKARADAYARHRRSQNFGDARPNFRARVVRWRRWMQHPRGDIVPVERLIERERRLVRLLGLEW